MVNRELFFSLLCLLLVNGTEMLQSPPALIMAGQTAGSINLFHVLYTVSSLVKSAIGNLAKLFQVILEFWTMRHQVMFAESVRQSLDFCKVLERTDISVALG